MPDGPNQPDRSAREPAAPAEASIKGWKKLEILGGFATPVAVALTGLFVSSYLDRQQSSETNTRAFAELISGRELADTNLRKEMFAKVLDSFFDQKAAGIDERVLKLEILAYNFHQSLDLGPIFQDILRGVDVATAQGKLRFARLKRIARDVIFKQMESLETDVGASRHLEPVDLLKLKDTPEGIVALDTNLSLPALTAEDAKQHEVRRFRVEVLEVDKERQELRIRLLVGASGKPDFREKPPEVDVVFMLGFFDFPGINNSRLSRGERCALALESMDEFSAQINLVYFPANRAGLKDGMYVEEFAREILKIRKQN